MYICSMKVLTILFLESLGGGELIVIMLFVLLFFGSKNIPSLARGLGKGIREFKDAMNGVQTEIQQGIRDVNSSVSNETNAIKSALDVNDTTVTEVNTPEAQNSVNKTIINPAAFTPPAASQPRE